MGAAASRCGGAVLDSTALVRMTLVVSEAIDDSNGDGLGIDVAVRRYRHVVVLELEVGLDGQGGAYVEVKANARREDAGGGLLEVVRAVRTKVADTRIVYLAAAEEDVDVRMHGAVVLLYLETGEDVLQAVYAAFVKGVCAADFEHWEHAEVRVSANINPGCYAEVSSVA